MLLNPAVSDTPSTAPLGAHSLKSLAPPEMSIIPREMSAEFNALYHIGFELGAHVLHAYLLSEVFQFADAPESHLKIIIIMEVLQPIIQASRVSPALAINIILQAIFFTLTVSSAITCLLKAIRFAYASSVMGLKIIQIGILVLFIYSKSWDSWHPSLIYYGYFCSFFLSLYACDCALNISSWYCQNVRGLYWGQVGLISLASFALWLYLYVHAIHKEYYFIFLLQLALIFIINAAKLRHVANSAVIVFLSLSLPIIRSILGNHLGIYISSFPMELLPLVMMAFDAEFRERVLNGSKEEESLNKAMLTHATYLIFYAGLNNVHFNIELVLPVVMLFLILR